MREKMELGDYLHDLIDGGETKLAADDLSALSLSELEAVVGLRFEDTDDFEAKVASFCEIGSSEKSWLDQFAGTPLAAKAIQLCEQELQIEQEELQRRIERDASMKADQDIWTKRDALRLQKSMLSLELAKAKAVGGGADPTMAAPRGAAEELIAEAPVGREGKTAGLFAAVKRASDIQLTGMVNSGDPSEPVMPRALLGFDGAGRRATPEEEKAQHEVAADVQFRDVDKGAKMAAEPSAYDKMKWHEKYRPELGLAAGAVAGTVPGAMLGAMSKDPEIASSLVALGASMGMLGGGHLGMKSLGSDKRRALLEHRLAEITKKHDAAHEKLKGNPGWLSRTWNSGQKGEHAQRMSILRDMIEEERGEGPKTAGLLKQAVSHKWVEDMVHSGGAKASPQRLNQFVNRMWRAEQKGSTSFNSYKVQRKRNLARGEAALSLMDIEEATRHGKPRPTATAAVKEVEDKSKNLVRSAAEPASTAVNAAPKSAPKAAPSAAERAPASEPKKGLSAGAKAVLGAGALATAGTAAYGAKKLHDHAKEASAVTQAARSLGKRTLAGEVVPGAAQLHLQHGLTQAASAMKKFRTPANIAPPPMLSKAASRLLAAIRS